MVDTSKLNEKLNALTGLDFELVESQERANGNTYLDVTFTKSFQARLAAQALGVPVADIKELPMKQYIMVCGQVLNFLAAPLDNATPATNSENSSPN